MEKVREMYPKGEKHPILDKNLTELLDEYSSLHAFDKVKARQTETGAINETIKGDMRKYFIDLKGARPGTEGIPVDYHFKEGKDKYHQSVEFVNNLIIKHIERTHGKEIANHYKKHHDLIETYIGVQEYGAIVSNLAQSNSSIKETLEGIAEQNPNLDLLRILVNKEHKEARHVNYLRTNLERLGYEEKNNTIARDYLGSKTGFEINQTKTISELLDPLKSLAQNSYKVTDQFKTTFNNIIHNKDERKIFEDKYRKADEEAAKKQIDQYQLDKAA
jgi:hypothetical protein